MFALSWVFLAAAIGNLVFGLSQEGLTFIYVSIAASILAILFMLAGVLRRPVRPATAGAPYAAPPEEAARQAEPASDRSQVLALQEPGTYHQMDCRIVKGRTDTEKITRGIAKRRGYSACAICKPAA